MGLVGWLVLSPLAAGVAAERQRLADERVAAAANREAPATPVIVQVARAGTVVDRLRLPGQVQALRQVTVAAQVKAPVLSWEAAEGKPVRRGQVILRLDEAEYRITLANAQALLRLAEQTLRATKELVAGRVQTPFDLERDQAAYDQARAVVDRARLDLDRCTVTSPIDGVLDDVLPEPGELVKADDPVAVVVDMGRMKMEIGIPEQDVSAVRSVRSCQVVVDSAAGGTVVTGEVTYLSLRPLPGALVYMLRLEVDNVGDRLRPGMFVSADIVKERREGALTMPLFAVVARGETHLAYVVPPDAVVGGVAVVQERKVRLGLIQGSTVEVLDGLAVGDRVVVVGQRSLGEGSRVRLMKTVESLGELAR